MKKDLNLYWEDVGERLLFAELDDYAWKLPEKLFKYKKTKSVYIFHQKKLRAYYSLTDSMKEAKIGYKFYSRRSNCKKIIALKRRIFSEVNKHFTKYSKIKARDLSKDELQKHIINSLDLFFKSLSVHYLSQPQFFENFNTRDLKYLQPVSQARLKYTRVAWTKAMSETKLLLSAYAQRQDISQEEMESVTLRELRSGKFNINALKQREKSFVIVSKRHQIQILTGKMADELIKKYQDHNHPNQLKGIIGNSGYITGKAFVIKNENLELSRLPSGMKKGMVLIIQNAWPEFIAYYKHAAAIVTNEGGITGHGVVISRELKIPCIVGTTLATKIFKNGDMVEVDANKGTVRLIK